MSIIIKRLIPYIIPLLAFAGIELAFAKPRSGWAFLMSVLIISIAAFYPLISI